MAGASVRVSIVAETRKFNSAMRNLKRATGLTALQRTAAKTAKAMAAIGGAGIAAGALITRSLWKAGETAGTSNARIENITQSMGLFGDKAGQVSKRIEGLADKMARSVGVDQNVIKSTQAKLLTFKELAASADKTGGAFDRATQAAVDLAAAGFGSAESNAVQLGKALNDPIKGLTALTKSGITFTEAEKEKIATLTRSGQVTQAQEMILKAIETQVGGTAKATANASDKFKIFGSQIKEHLGLKLTPIFDALADKLEAVLPAVMAFADRALGYLGQKAQQLYNWWNTTGAPALKSLWEYFQTNLKPVLEDIARGALSVLHAAFDKLASVAKTIVPAIASTVALFVEYKNVVLPLVGGVVAFVGAFRALRAIMVAVRAVQLAMAAANALLSASFLASPLGWVALAIGAIVAVGALLYANWQTISAALKRFGAWIKGVLYAAVKYVFIDLPLKILSTLGSVAGWLIGSLLGILKRVFIDIPASILSALMRLGSWLTGTFGSILRGIFFDLPKQIMGFIGNAGDWLYNIGKDVINGLVKGIKSMLSSIKNAISWVVDKVIGGFKSLLGIASPSRVMRDLARWIPEGVAEGVKNSTDSAVSSVARMGEQMTKQAAAVRISIPVGVDPLEDLDARAWDITARGSLGVPAPVVTNTTHEYKIEVKTLNATEETGRAIKNALRAFEDIDGAEASRRRAQWA